MSRLPVGSSARISDGLVDDRARDRGALALAAGELGRPVLRALGEADAAQRLARALLPLAPPMIPA